MLIESGKETRLRRRIQRIVFTGKQPMEVYSRNLAANGFDLTFTQPLNDSSVLNADNDGDDDILLGNYSNGVKYQQDLKNNWYGHLPLILLQIIAGQNSKCYVILNNIRIKKCIKKASKLSSLL